MQNTERQQADDHWNAHNEIRWPIAPRIKIQNFADIIEISKHVLHKIRELRVQKRIRAFGHVLSVQAERLDDAPRRINFQARNSGLGHARPDGEYEYRAKQCRHVGSHAEDVDELHSGCNCGKVHNQGIRLPCNRRKYSAEQGNNNVCWREHCGTKKREDSLNAANQSRVREE